MDIFYLLLITILFSLATQKTFLNNFGKKNENKIIVLEDSELETIRNNILTRHN